jgi:hypothetical protein
MSEKKEFVQRLLRYVAHKRIIINSRQDVIHSGKLNAMAKLTDVFKPIRDRRVCEQIPLNSIASLVLQVQPELQLILPHKMNKAFESSTIEINAIIETAREIHHRASR